MYKKLLSFFRHLVSTLGITLCSKCGSRTKLEIPLGDYNTTSKSKCKKCGTIDTWGIGAADSGGAGGYCGC